MSETIPTFWRKCTTCKKPISFKQKYWICSVSTCNRKRTGLVFCDVRCFDVHVPVLNHKDAGAYERFAPSQAEALSASPTATSTPVKPSGSAKAAVEIKSPKAISPEIKPEDILVVVSKVKDYIRSNSGMNTSDAVMGVLSKWVRRWADQGITVARTNNRKTVLDRDFR